jgi:hypothetical protein
MATYHHASQLSWCVQTKICIRCADSPIVEIFAPFAPFAADTAIELCIDDASGAKSHQYQLFDCSLNLSSNLRLELLQSKTLGGQSSFLHISPRLFFLYPSVLLPVPSFHIFFCLSFASPSLFRALQSNSVIPFPLLYGYIGVTG